MENRQEGLESLERNVRRLESVLLLETGDCKQSAEGLEKRLSKLEDVSGRLDGVLASIVQMKEGSLGPLVHVAAVLLADETESELRTSLELLSKVQNIWIWRYSDLL